MDANGGRVVLTERTIERWLAAPEQLLDGGERYLALLGTGHELVRYTLERFDYEVDPGGNPWVELKDSTEARKQLNKKLVENRQSLVERMRQLAAVIHD